MILHGDERNYPYTATGLKNPYEQSAAGDWEAGDVFYILNPG